MFITIIKDWIENIKRYRLYLRLKKINPNLQWNNKTKSISWYAPNIAQPDLIKIKDIMKQIRSK